jgi:hypothetical protein
MPASDTPCLAYPSLPEGHDNRFMELLVDDPESVGALRIDPGNPDPAVQAAIRAAFYGDVEPVKAAAVAALLSCDEPLAMVVGRPALSVSGWGSLPRTYVVCHEDRTIWAALQLLFVTQADAAFPHNPTHVVELAASHSALLSVPDRVADVTGHCVDGGRVRRGPAQAPHLHRSHPPGDRPPAHPGGGA